METAKKKMEDTASINDLSIKLGVSRPTIVKIASSLTPVSTDKRGKLYRISDVVKVMRMRERSRGTIKDTSKREAQVKVLEVQAKMKELELAEKEGKLVELDRVIDAFINLRTSIRQKILNIADGASVRCENRTAGQVRNILQDYIDEVLSELTTFDPTGDGPIQLEIERSDERIPASRETGSCQVDSQEKVSEQGGIRISWPMESQKGPLSEWGNGCYFRPSPGGDLLDSPFSGRKDRSGAQCNRLLGRHGSWAYAGGISHSPGGSGLQQGQTEHTFQRLPLPTWKTGI